MKKIVSAFIFIILGLNIAVAQDTGLEFVKKQYPQLSDMFKKELVSEHATYTFAIDVSGTMNKFSGIVIPALNSFVEALPNGDYVRIIRFGTTAKGSENGYLGTISENLKGDLKKAIGQLYTNTNDDKAFRAHTDIPAVMKEISSALQNSENNMNFVFILTDFRNDQISGGEHKITSKDLETIYYDLEPAATGKNGRIVALRLPVDVNATGYCLDQLKSAAFDKVALDYEMQDITSEDALSSWFEELKKQIMVERLRTIVSAENKVADISFDTDISIDGNVLANVQWKPNRLYASIQIDSSFIQDKRMEGDSSITVSRAKYTKSGFTFKNNPEVFQETTTTELPELELGKIKNKKFFFHKLDDELDLGVKLPTPYDDELHRLGVRKPIPDVAMPVKKLLFTFFLPFWLCATIVGIILLYLLLVLRKVGKNSKWSVRKTITAKDIITNEVVDKWEGRIKDSKGVTLSKLSGMQLTYFKKSFSPFLLHKKPLLKGKVVNGSACGDSAGRRPSKVITGNGEFYLKDNSNKVKYRITIR